MKSKYEDRRKGVRRPVSLSFVHEERGGLEAAGFNSPNLPRMHVPTWLQKSMMTSSATTPNKKEKPISGARVAKVKPGGVLLLVVSLLVPVLLESSEVLGGADSVRAAAHIRGITEMRALWLWMWMWMWLGKGVRESGGE